jgi:hypothetical protein
MNSEIDFLPSNCSLKIILNAKTQLLRSGVFGKFNPFKFSQNVGKKETY